MVLPVETDFVLVAVNANENVVNDAGPPEFDGHFADAATLILRQQLSLDDRRQPSSDGWRRVPYLPRVPTTSPTSSLDLHVLRVFQESFDRKRQLTGRAVSIAR